MSESKHTPGPWFVGAQNDALYIIDRRPAHDNDYPNHHADVGCIAKVYDDIRDAEIGRANAALIARAPDLAAEVERLRNSWRCFHCGDVFSKETDAAEHFGTSPALHKPACLIDIAEYRAMEERCRRYCEEDTELHRELHRMESRHSAAVLRAEEEGYAKGLKDYTAQEQLLAAERRKVEALRSASVGSRGWLVEWRYHGSVQWLYLWSAACGGFSFTADASEALRLARREDAEAVLEWARDTDSRRGLHSGTFLVTEHVWESAALASTEGGEK